MGTNGNSGNREEIKMIIYFEDGDRYMVFEDFSYVASTYESTKDAMEDNFTVIAAFKYYNRVIDIYAGPSMVCDRLVKEMLAAYERGEKVFRVDPRDWRADT